MGPFLLHRLLLLCYFVQALLATPVEPSALGKRATLEEVGFSPDAEWDALVVSTVHDTTGNALLKRAYGTRFRDYSLEQRFIWRPDGRGDYTRRRVTDLQAGFKYMLWIFVESERSHDEQVEVKPMLDFAGIGPPPNVQPQRVGEFLGVDVHEHRIEQMPLSPIGTPTWRTVAYIEAPGRQTMAIQFLPYVPRNEFLPDTVVFLQLYVAPNVSPSAVVSTNLPGATGPSSLGGQGPSGHGVQSPSRGVRRPRPDNPGERRPAKRPQGNSGPNIAMMHQPRPPPDDEPMADVDSYTWPGQ